jgi:cytosine/adenosine deaminase-related metal-dependent hydrolase
MPDILIEHGTIITLDPRRRIIEDGAVAIRGDRIVAVDTHAALASAEAFEAKIDASRMVVLPGLVDCHAHAGHGLVKTLGADDGDAWYRACEAFCTQASSDEFWAAEAALAALERLTFGATSGVFTLRGWRQYSAHRRSNLCRPALRVCSRCRNSELSGGGTLPAAFSAPFRSLGRRRIRDPRSELQRTACHL